MIYMSEPKPIVSPELSAYLSAIGRKGGRAGKGKTSARKAKTSAENGRKGGRPKQPRPKLEDDNP